MCIFLQVTLTLVPRSCALYLLLLAYSYLSLDTYIRD